MFTSPFLAQAAHTAILYSFIPPILHSCTLLHPKKGVNFKNYRRAITSSLPNMDICLLIENPTLLVNISSFK